MKFLTWLATAGGMATLMCGIPYIVAYFAARGWHVGRIHAANKNGPIRTESQGTYTLVNKP